MPYIGNTAANRFVAPEATTRLSGNGSATAFTLEHSVGSDEDILVSVDGVIQEPSVAYAVSNGTTLTFTAAPSNGTNNIFVCYLFRTVGTVSHPSNNALSASTGTFTGDLTVDTSTLKVDSTNNRIGVGVASPSSSLHIRTADSSATAESNAAVIIEGTDATRADLQFLGDAGTFQAIYFGDDSDADIGRIAYSHTGNTMRFNANASELLRILNRGVSAGSETTGIARYGCTTTVTLADDASVNITNSGIAGSYIVSVYERGNGVGGCFFVTFRGTGTLIAQGLSGDCSASDVDGDLCLISSSGSHSVTIKNRLGASKELFISIFAGNIGSS